MTVKGYIYHGLSGWTVCWFDGSYKRWIFGVSTWDDALGVLKGGW